MWNQQEWYKEVIKRTNHPILILPDLKEEVVNIPGRNLRPKAIPTWRAMAVLLESSSTRNQMEPIFQNLNKETLQERHSNSSSQASQRETIQIDSGCDQHMFFEEKLFTRMQKEKREICLADGSTVLSQGIGDVTLSCTNQNGKEASVTFKEVLYVPSFRNNLLSYGQLTTKYPDTDILGSQQVLRINGEVSLRVKLQNNLLFLVTSRRNCSFASTKERQEREAQLNHARFGHPGNNKTDMIEKFYQKKVSEEKCQSCYLVKNNRHHFRPSPEERQAKEKQERVAFDIAVVSTISVDDYKYVVGFVDEATRHMWVDFIQARDEAYTSITKYETNVGIPRCYRTDGEFNQTEFQRSCLERRIKLEKTCPYSSQQNAIIESQWKTLFQIARALLNYASIPKAYWSYATKQACYILNSWPRTFSDEESKVLSTPFKRYYGFDARIELLKTFGCDAYVHKLKEKRIDAKLSTRAKPGVHLGLSEDRKGFIVYLTKENRYVTSIDVTFHEDSFEQAKDLATVTAPSVIHKEYVQEDESESESSDSESEDSEVEDLEELLDDAQEQTSQREEEDNEEVTEHQNIEEVNLCEEHAHEARNIPDGFKSGSYEQEESEPRRSERIRGKTYNFASHAISSEENKLPPEPKSYYEVIKGDNKEEWLNAMEEEIEALETHETWKVVRKPKNKNIAGTKWVFKVKTNANGDFERFKARLVVQGFTQKFLLDYFETFAPVAKHETTRTAIGIAFNKNFIVVKVDIKNAYLNATVEEEIYIRFPKGPFFIEEKKKDKCLKLEKSLYGLKQAARNWYQTLSEWFLEIGYTRTKIDTCLFVKDDSMIVVYVDDIIGAFKDKATEELFKRDLYAKFRVGTYEDLNWHLSVEIMTVGNQLHLKQTSYIQKILKRFYMGACKRAESPTTGDKLCKRTNEEVGLPEDYPYRSLVGSLIYLVSMTRPDLAFAVHALSKYLNEPTMKHWIAGKRILRYLQGTKEKGLIFERCGAITLKAYSDANFAPTEDARRSTSGYVVFLNDTPIAWKAKLQATIALSTCEAELMALTEAAKEVIFLQQLIFELVEKDVRPTKIMVDNQSTIKMCENPSQHQRTKHIDVKYLYVRELIQEGKITLEYVDTNANVADVFTKPTVGSRFHELTKDLVTEIELLGGIM